MDKSSKKWYVYLLCDPDTELPFYVGKGTGDRINHHDQHPSRQVNERKMRMINQIRARGKRILKKKVAEFDNEQEAYAYEKSLIVLHGDHLTNLRTNSGAIGNVKKAPPGYYTAQEARERLGLNASTFGYYVRSGKIKRYVPPLRSEGFYKQEEIDDLANQIETFQRPEEKSLSDDGWHGVV